MSREGGVEQVGELIDVAILDWYDGIVSAIVRLSWREGLFLASLVAWSLEEKRRVLALVPVTQEQAEEFQALASQDWDQLTSRLKQFCQNLVGKVVVLSIDDRVDEVVAESEVPAADICRDMIADVSDALDPQRHRWFETSQASD